MKIWHSRSDEREIGDSLVDRQRTEMRQSLSSRIEDVLVKEGELCSAEIVEVGSRDIQVPLEANELDDLQVCALAQSPHTLTREAGGQSRLLVTFSGVLYFRKSL